MRKRRSTPGETRRGHGLHTVQHLFDNGLVAVLCPRPHLAQAYVSAFFSVGSRHESEQNNGITHFLEHMLFRGSRSFSDATSMNAAAEDFGGFLDGATYRDHLVFATGCHRAAIPSALSILGEIATSPRYRSLEVERSIVREEVLEGLDGDGRSIDLDNIAHRSIFGPRGLGLPIEGTLDGLDRISRDDLDAHRREFLVGENAVVAVAGPLDVDATLRVVEDAFGRLEPGKAAITAGIGTPRDEPTLRYVRDASSQVDMRISFPAAAVFDPDYPTLLTLSRVLADGLSSRMHAELVDRRGLAYALNAGLATYGDCGLFEFEVSVSPTRAAEAVAAILDFASSAGRFRYTETELARVRRRFRYGMQFMGDCAADLTSWYGRAALFGVEKETQMLESNIMRVTPADLRRAARLIFQRRGLVLTAVGELARGQWSQVRRVVDAWSGR